jgi:hypothetical protein
MGATRFHESGRGKSAQEVYSKLVNEAEYENGHDCYNGTISTTAGFHDVTKEWKASKKGLDSYISAMLNDAKKYDCFCICIRNAVENKNKTKSQVEHIVTPGTKKWVLKYVVYNFDDQLGSYNTKGEAVKAARAYTEKTQKRTSIVMEKKLEKGGSQVATITYKTSTTEKDGEYVFFGYAGE